MKALGLAAGLWALGFGPGAAQDILFEERHTVACLQEAVSEEEIIACAGASATVCMEATPEGGSTIGMSACIGREFDWWDERLNAVYQELRAAERAEDEEMADLPGAPNQVEALRQMQLAWVNFRDATCAYERAQWGGGTGGGPATMACLMRMTAEQTIYLEQVSENW